MKILIAILVSSAMLASAQPSVAQYAVQVGAYKDPSTIDTGQLGTFGDVQLNPGADGITRIRVGSFATAQAADSTLRALRNAGYSDAYIMASNRRASTAYSAPTRARVDNDDLGTRYLAAKAKLPAASEGQIVVVDGRLMLKLGDQFRPLD